MFSECPSLLSLPDIPKWNTNNIKDMNGKLIGCSSLSYLPDIPKWNTNNVEVMKYMFSECLNIILLKMINMKFKL